MEAVVIDVDFNLSAAKMMRAQVQLQNPKCLFLAGAADALIPFGKGDIIGERERESVSASLFILFYFLKQDPEPLLMW